MPSYRLIHYATMYVSRFIENPSRLYLIEDDGTPDLDNRTYTHIHLLTPSINQALNGGASLSVVAV